MTEKFIIIPAAPGWFAGVELHDKGVIKVIGFDWSEIIAWRIEIRTDGFCEPRAICIDGTTQSEVPLKTPSGKYEIPNLWSGTDEQKLLEIYNEENYEPLDSMT